MKLVYWKHYGYNKDNQKMNFFRTALLLAAMTALFMVIGYLIGGGTGTFIAFLIACGMNFFSYWNSDKIVLAMYKAKEVDANSAPEYYNIVTQLAKKANLPQPRIYIIENPQPNAFATGRDPNNAAVAATTGILQLLNKEELAGVMAHELAHVKNRDTLTMTMAATLAGAISMVGNFFYFFGASRENNENRGAHIIGTILMIVLAPLAASLIQMAISRTREYSADHEGAKICGNPLWLASALQKLENKAKLIPNQEAEQNPSTAHLFIINPLFGERMDNLFSTHPNTENRVAELEALAAKMGKSYISKDSTTVLPKATPAPEPSRSNFKNPWL